MELDAQVEFARLKALYADEVTDFFRSLTTGGSIDWKFDREVIERLLDLSPPGIDEIMALTRVIELMETDKYDMFVLDTAPTGHLIRLLELPELIEQWLKAIFGLLLKYKNVLRLPKVSDFLVDLSKKTKRLRSLLTDRDSCWLCAVSIPTQMALEETRDLLATCWRAAIHVPIVFLNMVTQSRDCPTCRALADEEAKVRKDFDKEFAELKRPVIYRCPELAGRERLASLGRVLYRK
jgi:arsenite-transporting ATPase